MQSSGKMYPILLTDRTLKSKEKRKSESVYHYM